MFLLQRAENTLELLTWIPKQFFPPCREQGKAVVVGLWLIRNPWLYFQHVYGSSSDLPHPRVHTAVRERFLKFTSNNSAASAMACSGSPLPPAQTVTPPAPQAQQPLSCSCAVCVCLCTRAPFRPSVPSQALPAALGVHP